MLGDAALQMTAKISGLSASCSSMLQTADREAVVEALRIAKARCIGIDGIDGCGKSTLARVLAANLQRRVFSVDNYLDKNKGGYLEFIDYSRLRADVSAEEKCVIEGVCLLEVLKRAQLRIDVLVYVKRRHLGLWADEEDLDLSEPLEDFLEKERKLTGIVSREPVADLGLAEEVIRYHHAMRPFDKAYIVYFRDED